MSRSIFRVVRIVALCTFAVASSARAQDTTPVEKLREEGKLDEKKNHPADSGEDAAKGYTRQGFGHIRQGNTSSDKDPFGRAFAPYGGESYETLAKKFEDRLNTPDWTLGIDMQEPRRIVVEYPDGTAQEYWYILFRLINDNYRKVSTKVVSDYDPSKAGTGEINAVNIENQEAERWEGIPVRANIDVVVETLRYNTHAEPVRHGDEKRDDLHAELTKEAEKDTGKGLSGNADTAEAERLVKERYQHARKTYTDISDAWVLQRIAEQEQLWEWRDGKREYILWPASAFKAEIAPAYEYESDWLDGPRCLPHQVEKFDEKGNLYIVTRYPGVYEDNSWAGYFGEQDTLPAGVRLVKGPDDASGMYGKLTKRRYKNYDVVDRFGRVLGENEPGYLAAKAAGGRIVKNNPDIGDKGNLDALIGQTARRPAHRRYKAGDHVLMEWDTGVAMPGRPNQNYIINGMIIQPGDNGIHKGYDKIRREYTGLNPKADEEVGTVAVRASQEDRYQTAKVLSEDDELFRRRPVSEHIPVKVLDYLGRPVTRGAPVTYQIGDTVTELEYRIWAERYPAELVKRFEKTSAEKYGSEPWKRTLQFHDFLVGLPKIKMGRGEDISVTTPETLKRGIAKKIENGQVVEMDVVDYVTGRPYDPKMIKPDVFMRDPDGTFTTFRTPPVPPNAALAEGEAYVYAPLGPADVGAMPVPRFDRFGVWEDYVHPVSGKRIPLVDGKGELVRDQYDQI
ncbi:MAG: hypothetical protein L6Q71_11150, partial [Planctomycetes bacterium]|nr:hypothetical protein [Planctomycetota bacterium]